MKTQAVKKLTPEELIKIFILHCEGKNLSPKTVSWYSYILRSFLEYCQRQGISSVSREAIESYLSYLRTKPVINNMTGKQDRPSLSNASLRGHYRGLKVFFSFCQREELLAKNPMDSLATPRKESRIIASLTVEQVQKLLACIRTNTFLGMRNHLIIALLLDTGMRVNELIGIKTADINWREGTIKVYGKGRKEREVPVSSFLKRLLWKYLSRRPQMFENEYLFVNGDGERITEGAIRTFLKRYAKKAGINGVRVSPHTFRHTFARLWIINGGDPFSLQKILGHTTMDMVRNYVNLISGDVIEKHRQFSPLERLNSRR